MEEQMKRTNYKYTVNGSQIHDNYIRIVLWDDFRIENIIRIALVIDSELNPFGNNARNAVHMFIDIACRANDT